ncbi:MAG: DUF362 domain-containing protein [Bacillota bacterium]
MSMGAKATKTTVAVTRTADPFSPELVTKAVDEALRLVPGWRGKAAAAERIVVKPNLTADNVGWETGVVTSTLVMDAVLGALRAANPRAELTIAEATAVGLDTKKAFARVGLAETAARHRGRLADLNDDEHLPVSIPGGAILKKVYIARTVLEADFLVDVPVLKTHAGVGITVAMKNLKGTMPAREKKRFHNTGLIDCIVDLNRVVKPALVVADGTVALEGDGPVGGTPVNFGVIVAGTHTAAVDLVAGRLMGFAPDEIDALRRALELGQGVPEEDIAVVGESVAAVARPFKRAVFPFEHPDNVCIVDGKACTGCREGLRIAIDRAKAQEVLALLPRVGFFIGPGAKVGPEDAAHPERNVIIGKCLKDAANKGQGRWVPGCPPQIFLITDEMREMAGKDRLFGRKKDFIVEDDDDH